MKTPVSSVVMFLIAALLGAVGQYLYKVGSGRAGSPPAVHLVAEGLGAAVATRTPLDGAGLVENDLQRSDFGAAM